MTVRLPSGVTTTLRGAPPIVGGGETGLLAHHSKARAVASTLVESTQRPSKLKIAAMTELGCSNGGQTSRPARQPQTCTVRSRQAVTRSRPAGLILAQ